MYQLKSYEGLKNVVLMFTFLVCVFAKSLGPSDTNKENQPSDEVQTTQVIGKKLGVDNLKCLKLYSLTVLIKNIEDMITNFQKAHASTNSGRKDFAPINDEPNWYLDEATGDTYYINPSFTTNSFAEAKDFCATFNLQPAILESLRQHWALFGIPAAKESWVIYSVTHLTTYEDQYEFDKLESLLFRTHKNVKIEGVYKTGARKFWRTTNTSGYYTVPCVSKKS